MGNIEVRSMTKKELENEGWEEIIGKKIIEVRSMTKKELENEGWDDMQGTVLVLDEGTKLYASQDDEGNGPGVIFGQAKNGTSFGVRGK